MDFGELLDALTLPAAHSEAAEDLYSIQTSMSGLVFAEPWAYKLKKPVQTDTLDFSTAEAREFFCGEEVRLNRRMATDVYEGVVPVNRDGDRITFGGPGETIEHAVKMKCLPSRARFTAYLERGELNDTMVEEFAERLALFHQSAAHGPRVSASATSEVIGAKIDSMINNLSGFIGSTISEPVFDGISKYLRREFELCRELIDRRAERGVPRELHGDLHLDHIYAFPEREIQHRYQVIDCIEYNPMLRFGDPISELSTLVMDLDYQGRRDLARALTESYMERSRDEEGSDLLSLYVAIKAVGHGLADGAMSRDEKLSEFERQAAVQRASAHFMVAARLLLPAIERPCLIMICGLPGSGKSTLRDGLVSMANFTPISTTEVRREIVRASNQKFEDTATFGKGHYDEEWNGQTYAKCVEMAESALFRGERVLIDGTFTNEEQRLEALDAAAAWNVPCLIFQCESDKETSRVRMDGRRQVSGADWGIFEEKAARWEDWGAKTSKFAHAIPMTAALDERLEKVYEVLTEEGLA